MKSETQSFLFTTVSPLFSTVPKIQRAFNQYLMKAWNQTLCLMTRSQNVQIGCMSVIGRCIWNLHGGIHPRSMWSNVLPTLQLDSCVWRHSTEDVMDCIPQPITLKEDWWWRYLQQQNALVWRAIYPHRNQILFDRLIASHKYLFILLFKKHLL